MNVRVSWVVTFAQSETEERTSVRRTALHDCQRFEVEASRF